MIARGVPNLRRVQSWHRRPVTSRNRDGVLARLHTLTCAHGCRTRRLSPREALMVDTAERGPRTRQTRQSKSKGTSYISDRAVGRHEQRAHQVGRADTKHIRDGKNGRACRALIRAEPRCGYNSTSTHCERTSESVQGLSEMLKIQACAALARIEHANSTPRENEERSANGRRTKFIPRKAPGCGQKEHHVGDWPPVPEERQRSVVPSELSFHCHCNGPIGVPHPPLQEGDGGGHEKNVPAPAQEHVVVTVLVLPGREQSCFMPFPPWPQNDYVVTQSMKHAGILILHYCPAYSLLTRCFIVLKSSW